MDVYSARPVYIRGMMPTRRPGSPPCAPRSSPCDVDDLAYADASVSDPVKNDHFRLPTTNPRSDPVRSCMSGRHSRGRARALANTPPGNARLGCSLRSRCPCRGVRGSTAMRSRQVPAMRGAGRQRSAQRVQSSHRSVPPIAHRALHAHVALRHAPRRAGGRKPGSSQEMTAEMPLKSVRAFRGS